MRVTLIHNPGAGNEQPSGDDLLALVRKAGHKVTYQSSKEGDWDGALEDPGDLVAAAGGDGTVGKVAKRLVGRRVPIAVLPLGTANNISKAVGLTDLSLEQLIAGWAAARRVRFDVGVITPPWESNYFIEGIGMGLFASTMSRLDATDNIDLDHLDDTEERITSVLEMLRGRLQNYAAKKLQATLDGQDVSGEYVLLEAMNIRYIGPNLQLAPAADPGDGLLDVVLVSEGEREKLSEYLDNCLKGKPCSPRLTVRRGQHLQIEWNEFDTHVDDEVWPSRAGLIGTPNFIDVKVERHALEFLLPAWGQ